MCFLLPKMRYAAGINIELGLHSIRWSAGPKIVGFWQARCYARSSLVCCATKLSPKLHSAQTKHPKRAHFSGPFLPHKNPHKGHGGLWLFNSWKATKNCSEPKSAGGVWQQPLLLCSTSNHGLCPWMNLFDLSPSSNTAEVSFINCFIWFSRQV